MPMTAGSNSRCKKLPFPNGWGQCSLQPQCAACLTMQQTNVIFLTVWHSSWPIRPACLQHHVSSPQLWMCSCMLCSISSVTVPVWRANVCLNAFTNRFAPHCTVLPLRWTLLWMKAIRLWWQRLSRYYYHDQYVVCSRTLRLHQLPASASHWRLSHTCVCSSHRRLLCLQCATVTCRSLPDLHWCGSLICRRSWLRTEAVKCYVWRIILAFQQICSSVVQVSLTVLHCIHALRHTAGCAACLLRCCGDIVAIRLQAITLHDDVAAVSLQSGLQWIPMLSLQYELFTVGMLSAVDQDLCL